MNYSTASIKLGARQSRKIGNNTYLERKSTYIAVRLHSTEIVRFYPGHIVLDSGGWRTATTKNRINDYVPGRGLRQRAGIWYFSDGSVFMDHVRVDNEYGLPLNTVNQKTKIAMGENEDITEYQ